MSGYLERALREDAEVTFRELYEEADRSPVLDAARLNDVFYDDRGRRFSRYGSTTELEPDIEEERYHADHEARELYADADEWEDLSDRWLTVLEKADEAEHGLPQPLVRTGRFDSYADMADEDLVDARESANALKQGSGALGSLLGGGPYATGATDFLGQDLWLDAILLSIIGAGTAGGIHGARKQGRVEHEIKYRQLEALVDEVGSYTVCVGQPEADADAAAATGV